MGKVGRPRDKVERPPCPKCGGSDIVKAGVIHNTYLGADQVWYCNDCQRSFKEKALARKIRRKQLISPEEKIQLGHERLLKEIFAQPPGFVGSRNRQNSHRKLKALAHDLLINLGCSNIQDEFILVSNEENIVRVDVAGMLNGKIIVVECGGLSGGQRLKILSEKVVTGEIAQLYILPFGETQFYKWTEDMEVCNCCGHRIE